MSNTTASPFEALNQTLNQLTTEYGEFLDFWDQACASGHAATIGEAIMERWFSSKMLVNGQVGYHSDILNVRLVYGDMTPNGNMEGSLYLHFGEGDGMILRCRWLGDNALYLSGTGNYVRVERRPLADDAIRTTLKPGRIGGRTILAIEEGGVRTQHPLAYTKRMYESMVARGESTEGIVEDPGNVQDIIVRHEELTTVLENIREGVRLARAVVEELMTQRV